jgi:PIN domain nuclease of toxin-antitoxin system
VIYLDTHVLGALDRKDFRGFEKEALRLIDQDPDIRISPMILVELDFLEEIRRIREGQGLVERLIRNVGLRVCDRPFADIARAAAAEHWTRDPFDRIIVAQARLAKAPLITRDTTIQSHYGRAVG